jgi:hypothetical protein
MTKLSHGNYRLKDASPLSSTLLDGAVAAARVIF